MAVDNRPTIFLSSTVRDFQDLRSALRFYLEQSGYRVLLSESAQFPVDPSKSNFQICLDAVDQCDIYMLLVGNRRGTFYDATSKTTITQEEYRRARARFDRGDDIQLLTFVREETFVAADEASDGSSESTPHLEDPDFTKRFLHEVMQPKSDNAVAGANLPRGAWVWRFGSFSDIVQALETVLRLNTNRQRDLLMGQALAELNVIIRSCFDEYTQSGEVFPNFQPLMPVINAKSDKTVRLKASVLRHAAVLGSFGWSFKWVRTNAITRLAESGELAEYDVGSKSYRPTKVSRMLDILIAEIERVQSYFRTQSLDKWFQQLERVQVEAANAPEDKELLLSPEVASHLWMNARTYRIFTNARWLKSALQEGDPVAWLESQDVDPASFHLVAMSGDRLEPPSDEKIDRWFQKQYDLLQRSSDGIGETTS